MSTRCVLAFVFLSVALNGQIFAQLRGPGLPGMPPAMGPGASYSIDHGEPINLNPPKPPSMTGVVSLTELEHPIPDKAMRAAFDGQRYARENKIAKAIQKLEQAIHIFPRYRDAHNDLGVEYARLKRFQDAEAEFRKALEIGPPVCAIYVNLALSAAERGNAKEAMDFARKTLDLESENGVAKEILALAAAR